VSGVGTPAGYQAAKTFVAIWRLACIRRPADNRIEAPHVFFGTPARTGTAMQLRQSFVRVGTAMAFWTGALLLIRGEAVGQEQPEKEQSAAARKLFNGRDLAGWQVADKFFFDEHGKVEVRDGVIHLAAGNPATGIAWKGELPRTNYEVHLDAQRVEGSDFFCGLTFPVGDAYCTFIAGGWGGGATGLSNIDNLPAVENETTDYINFQTGKWYHFRLRVTDERIEVWIDDKQIVNVQRDERKFSIWFEQEPMRPLGIASWYTTAALRNIELRTPAPAEPRPEPKRFPGK
jgi:hypothetical protein